MKIKIKITTSVKTKPIKDFAFDCKRSAPYINKCIDEGQINYAVAWETRGVKASGFKLVIIDEKARSFKKACADLDKRREAKV